MEKFRLALAVGLAFRERHNASAVPQRIVWTGNGSLHTFFVAMVNPGWPDAMLTEMLQEKLSAAYDGEDGLELVSQGADPHTKLKPSEEANKRYGWIKPLVLDQETHFKLMSLRERGAILRAHALQTGVSYQTLCTWLWRYWAGGLSAHALETGGLIKEKKERLPNAREMTGPAPVGQAEPGLPVNQDTIGYMETAATMCLANPRRTRQAVLNEVNETICPGISQFFTVRQLGYYMARKYPFSVIKRKRVGHREFDLNHRAFFGRSEACGPGTMFQIDATVGDIYLVSMLDRNRIVGRPTIYLIIDVFSRMIVGIYVGYEPPSYFGAALAMENAVTSKVAYCAEFGIEIDESAWPSHHLCATLRGDGGSDVTSRSWDYLINTRGVTMSNTKPFRPDWKAVVESRFNVIAPIWSEYTPGYVDKDFKQRGGRDYRLDAALTLQEFTAILLSAILEYNNRPLRTRPQSGEMVRQGIPPTPAEWWHFGVEQGLGKLQVVDIDTLSAAMYPRMPVTVEHRGIRHAGTFWETPRAIREEWFIRARQHTRKAEIAYSPRNLQKAYVIYDDGTFERATTRATGPAIDAGLTYSEFQQQGEAAKENLAVAFGEFRPMARKEQTRRSKLVAEALALTAKAREAVGQGHPSTKEIRKNRARERDLERLLNAGKVPPVPPQESGPGFAQKGTAISTTAGQPATGVSVEMLREMNRKKREQGE